MATVRTCLSQKPTRLICVEPGDTVQRTLELMKENRVRSVLVMEGDQLAGIITQGDCAIRVLLVGHNAHQTRVADVMTKNPATVKLDDPLEACMRLMANHNFRHLPVVDEGKVVGVVSIGDMVKNIIRQLGDQVSYLETYIRGHGG